MKKLLLTAIFLLAASSATLANPFRTRFVCAPPPDRIAAEFKVRDRGQCVEGELYLEVLPQPDGSVLLLPPAPDALTPEQARDLENYRRYFGGENSGTN